MGEVIRYCHEQNFREFDFLRGLEPYKAKWSKSSRSTMTCEIALSGKALIYGYLTHIIRGLRKSVKNQLLSAKSQV
jgi:CelD/BcsL family acetyltransferase involved in cellulose biosynthesis